MWLNLNLNLFMFLSSCLLFSYFYKHILLTMISLEFMMINLLMNIYMVLIYMNMNIYFISMFLSISVCESVLGLSVLVYLINNSGNDYMNSLNLLKW